MNKGEYNNEILERKKKTKSDQFEDNFTLSALSGANNKYISSNEESIITSIYLSMRCVQQIRRRRRRQRQQRNIVTLTDLVKKNLCR